MKSIAQHWAELFGYTKEETNEKNEPENCLFF